MSQSIRLSQPVGTETEGSLRPVGIQHSSYSKHYLMHVAKASALSIPRSDQ